VKDGKRMGCLGFHNFIVGNSPIVGYPETEPKRLLSGTANQKHMVEFLHSFELEIV